MKKILLTTIIALGLGSIAVAQQEPVKAGTAQKNLTKPKAERLADQARLLKYKNEVDKAAQQATTTKSKASPAADKATDAAKN